MSDAEEYHGWKIVTEYSGDVVFQRQAIATKSGEHAIVEKEQYDEAAIRRVKAVIDQNERMGS